ncbi:hypothetical protein D030_3460B, partial [Vibrio parahaemolyticus AQ3810]
SALRLAPRALHTSQYRQTRKERSSAEQLPPTSLKQE